MSPWLGYFALLLLLVAAGILLPVFLKRGKHGGDRAQNALEVHRARLDQLARDREAGRIGKAEAEGTEAEIKRAMLSAAREQQHAARLGESRSPWPLAGLSVAAIALGVVVYAGVGRYGAEDVPLAARSGGSGGETETAARGDQEQRLRSAVERLRARLVESPGDERALNLLARAYSALGASDKAIDTYRRLLAREPENAPTVRGDLGEVLVRRDGGAVGPDAATQFESVLEARPGDARARYYLALRDAQAGRLRAAAESFAAILREAPADAGYRPAIREVLDAVIRDGDLDRASLDIPAPTAGVRRRCPRGPDA